MTDPGRAKGGVSRTVLLLIAGLAIGLAEPAALARAQSVVTNTNDAGAGSLRDALDTAVAEETITFDLGTAMDPVIAVPIGAPLVVTPDLVRIDGIDSDLEIRGEDPDEVILRVQTPQVGIRDIDLSVGTVALDGELTYETTRPVTLDVTIVDEPLGTGSLFKQGPSTLILTGTNTYTGDTTVLDGVLRGPAAAFPDAVIGGVPRFILNGATVVFDQPADPGNPSMEFVYSGVIADFAADDPGVVEKDGSGILRLDGGDQFWSGGTIVRAGTLALSPNTTLEPDASIQIQSGATLRREVPPGSMLTWNGALTGGGTLQVQGDGSALVLNSGALTGPLVYDGMGSGFTVADSANVVRGAITFADDDDVFLLTSGGVLNGSITGPGTLILDPGLGNAVALGGTNSHDGTQILSGTVSAFSASLSGDVDNQAALEILGGGGALTAVVDGPGSVAITGSQPLTIAVDQLYTGPTEVRSGALVLDASLAATPTLTVQGPGTLRGVGAAPVADLQVFGTVAPTLPALPAGTDPLTVNTALFEMGSTLQMALRDDGTSAQLATIGALDASGATLIVTPEAGDYSTPVMATLLTSGGLTPPMLGSDGFAFLTVTPSFDATTYSISVQSSLDDLAAFAQTPNQLAVANDLQDQIDAFEAAPTPDPQWQPFIDAFQVLPESEVAAAYDALSGEVYTAMPSAHLATADRFARTLHRRSRGASWASGDALLSLAGGGGEPQAVAAATPRARRAADSASGLGSALYEEVRSSLWLEGWGELAELDGGGDASDVDLTLAGATLGYDYRNDLGFGVGAAVGYTYAGVDVSDLPTDAEANGVQTALYGGWNDRWGYLSAAGRFSWARNEIRRTIDVTSFSAEAEADYDTIGYGAGGEAGVNLAQLGPISLVPFASVDWTRLDSDELTEDGAGVLSLRVEGDTIDSIRSELGLRIGADLEIDEVVTLLPELRGSWRHEYGDTDRDLTTVYVGSFTGVPVEILGAEEPRDAAILGLGWSARVFGLMEAHAEYDAILDGDNVDHVLAITARLRF